MFAIYLVPPHSGQGFPVILRYGHIPNDGIIAFNSVIIIGKRITYMDLCNFQVKKCLRWKK